MSGGAAECCSRRSIAASRARALGVGRRSSSSQADAAGSGRARCWPAKSGPRPACNGQATRSISSLLWAREGIAQSRRPLGGGKKRAVIRSNGRFRCCRLLVALPLAAVLVATAAIAAGADGRHTTVTTLVTVPELIASPRCAGDPRGRHRQMGRQRPGRPPCEERRHWPPGHRSAAQRQRRHRDAALQAPGTFRLSLPLPRPNWTPSTARRARTRRWHSRRQRQLRHTDERGRHRHAENGRDGNTPGLKQRRVGG